jgi:hypothetical protein
MTYEQFLVTRREVINLAKATNDQGDTGEDYDVPALPGFFYLGEPNNYVARDGDLFIHDDVYLGRKEFSSLDEAQKSLFDEIQKFA